MKRNICILMAVILSFMVFLPVYVHAETYYLSGTDMDVEVDDSLWYVFTRDNIKNNFELDEFGISYDEIYNVFYDNNVYMDAFWVDDEGRPVELFVRKGVGDFGITNLSNYENEEILEGFAKELAEFQGSEEYSVYGNYYKFVKSEYFDSNLGYYISEFTTVVNGDLYNLTFQSTSQFTNRAKYEMQFIIDSIRFDVDANIRGDGSTSIFDGALGKALTGGIIGAIFAIPAMLKKKKRSSYENDGNSFADTTKEN